MIFKSKKQLINLVPRSLFFGVLALLFICNACQPEVVAHTDNVEITIDVKNVSAGFAHVSFQPNKEAFYLIGIQPVQENIDPQKVAKHFMLLALDSAYLDYLQWRNQHLNNLTPFVADFASHSLHYGVEEHFFTFLESGKDYWVFAFAVDHHANKPVGKLFCETIHTNDTSSIPVYFHYRVEGKWDYVYPMDRMDTIGEIITYVPWVGETVDSVSIREAGFDKPGHYFFNRFLELSREDNPRVFYGISVVENNGEAEHSSAINFEVGKTYYTGMAALDAPLDSMIIEDGVIINPPSPLIFDIYRFVWQGDSTDLYFTPAQCTHGEWFPPTTEDPHPAE